MLPQDTRKANKKLLLFIYKYRGIPAGKSKEIFFGNNRLSTGVEDE
ncbi:MAG: hypothetical protein SPD43_03025 [Candidatus Enterosoma sp.]|nr:hypothetical protein [Candidatus Enterosoma sp.]